MEQTPIEKSARFGHGAWYSDGDKQQSEDSLDRENKAWDFWGYTWPREYNLNRVVYTTGDGLKTIDAVSEGARPTAIIKPTLKGMREAGLL